MAWLLAYNIWRVVSLALSWSPTQKVGMELQIKLQIIQQLTTLVTFFQIRTV